MIIKIVIFILNYPIIIFNAAKIQFFGIRNSCFAFFIGEYVSSVIQPHYLYWAIGAELQAVALFDLSGVAEAALLHHTARRGIVGEIVAPDGAEPLRVEAVVNQQAQCLGTDATVPVGLGDPVARLDVVLADVDVALAVGQVADAADRLAGLLQFDGPDMVAMEEGSDDFAALLYTFVGKPATSRSASRLQRARRPIHNRSFHAVVSWFKK